MIIVRRRRLIQRFCDRGPDLRDFHAFFAVLRSVSRLNWSEEFVLVGGARHADEPSPVVSQRDDGSEVGSRRADSRG
jgi:hypothetical protein